MNSDIVVVVRNQVLIEKNERMYKGMLKTSSQNETIKRASNPKEQDQVDKWPCKMLVF